MKKIHQYLILLLSSFVVACNPVINKQKLVENNLLPVNVFVGEEPYTILERMEYYKVPGVSITVIQNYKVLWTENYGFADIESETPVGENTLFNIGSLSKGLSSLTVLALVQQGKIELDSYVNDQLVSWKIPENQFTSSKNVTPKLLMNHSGGVMHSYATNYTRKKFPSITQFLNGEYPALEKATVVDRYPASEFLYSNPGFAILQQLVEDVEEDEFYRVAQKNVFSVLGMHHSTFQQPLPNDWEIQAATGYRNGNKPMNEKRYFYPNTAAGGVWTTSADFANYVIELQKSYLGESNKIISQKLAQEMLKTHVSPEYGLGLFIRKIGDQFYFGHMGDNAGFFAGFISHITDGNAVIVFTNSNAGAELIKEINKSVAKIYDWKSFLPEELAIVPIEDFDLKAIEGRYRTGSDGVLNVKLIDNSLFLAEYQNEKLFHVGNCEFMMKLRAGKIKFTKDDSGKFSFAQFHFADNIGRLAENMSFAKRMRENEFTPSELLRMGKTDDAIGLFKEIYRNDSLDKAVSESRLNQLGYKYLGEGKNAQASAVFKLNVDFYPFSANCYDSYAEALAKSGLTKEAIRYYQKALEISPALTNAEVNIEKLKQLL